MIQAAETPAMLLPPVTFPAVDGLRVYPAQPALEDKTEGRTDALTATRTDTATYILQRAGGYLLPAIDVRWWNAGEGRVETAHVDAVTMQVAPNPAVQSAGASAPKAPLNWTAIVDLMAEHWRFALLATLVVVGLIWARAWSGAKDCSLSSPSAAGVCAIRGLCLQPVSPCGPVPRRKGRLFRHA